MILEVPVRLPLILALTIAAGALDSLAFTYSASIWNEGKLVWLQAAKAAVAFFLGILLYWISVRYLAEAGVVAAEVQTLIWFAATIIGVTALSGRFLYWPVLDQVAALFALLSLGWLIMRTSASA